MADVDLALALDVGWAGFEGDDVVLPEGEFGGWFCRRRRRRRR
jgi:hypothetical protein